MKQWVTAWICLMAAQNIFAAPPAILFRGRVDARYNNTRVFIECAGMWNEKDTVTISNGQFSFRQLFKNPAVYTFTSEYEVTQNMAVPLIVMSDQPGIISISMNGATLAQAQVKGSSAQLIFEQFLKERQNLLRAPVPGKPEAGRSLVNTSPVDDTVTAPLAIRTALKYPNSIVSAYLLDHFAANAPPEELENAYYHLSEPVRETYYGRHAAIPLNRLKSVERGQTVAGFSLADASGSIVHFSDFKDKKVVLVNFWASWCGPCREEFKILRQVYDKYKDQGFTIISISADISPAAWKKALAQEQLPWTQLSDPYNASSLAKRRFGVTGFPTVFLLDKNRKILYRDLRGTVVLEHVIEGLLRENE